MAFEVAPLPYDYAALEPYIDAQTMKLHHDKHHQTYVDNLNKAVESDPGLQDKSLDDIVAVAGSASPVVRNNGGGHWNHTFFWEIMGPAGGQPDGELADAISSRFGSLEGLQEQFNSAGLNRFGSGWVWLIAVPGQGLEVVSTPNQDNPLMDLAEKKGPPILGNDVWEHAYYLNYQNRRADYLKAWWNVVNWDAVQQRFSAI
jgi:Fe-Mn family superoxide dismutase